MRAPRFIQESPFYKKLKEYRRVQRMIFFIETYLPPIEVRELVRKVSRNEANGDEIREADHIESLRAELERNGEKIDEISISDICKISSKNHAWCMFIFHLVRKFRPERCIEMGTCLGISGAYIGSALRLNGQGRLITLEGSPGRADIARENYRRLGLDNITVRTGDFSTTLPMALNDAAPVDLVFVDGHHDGDATVKYFEIIRPHLSPRNVVIFDDITWSEGMRRAWRKIQSETGGLDLGPVGVCINM